MKERLLLLRKYLKMSQKEFAERLGMAQSTYAPLEKDRQIRDAYIILICQTYKVNEQWFRVGEGEMFLEEPDRELEELLNIYDRLLPSLQHFLFKQAKELQSLQDNLEI